ncbi:MAG: HlyC/CorC family transporter [Thiotrichales bacterium]|nr:HlyC/CorC family transporter [Thiotrichales bacterium]
MDDIPLSVLFGALFILIVISGFFSSSETAMMALNRYRLRHLADSNHRAAKRANALLDKPDRLIGLILLGNNLVNFMAASIATLIGIRLLGDLGAALSPIVLVVVFLIFAEVLPKTVAAFKPEQIAFPFSLPLLILMKLMYPAVWVINAVSNSLLKMFGFDTRLSDDAPLSREELRRVVNQAGTMIPRRHQGMLLSILDLENVTVDDIMVPRNEIVGINLEEPVAEIIEQLKHCQHTRLPVFRGNLDKIIGMVHVRRILRLLDHEEIDLERLEAVAREPLFIPEGTPLHKQLLSFQKQKKRTALVVDEYGVIQGLVTLEDILEEIVGEFTTDMQNFNLDIHPQEDGSYNIDATVTIREINRQLNWHLPADGPKTLNGLILEHLEDIPESGTSLKIAEYTVEIIKTADNAVRIARVLQTRPEIPDEPDHAQ